MIELLKKTLEALRKRTGRNMEVIHQNNMIARAMLEEPLTDEQPGKIEARYRENQYATSRALLRQRQGWQGN